MNRQGICSGWEGCSCGVQGECVFCYFCKLLRGGLAAEWGGKWEKDTSTHGEGCGRGQGRARVEGRGRGEGSGGGVGSGSCNEQRVGGQCGYNYKQGGVGFFS